MSNGHEMNYKFGRKSNWRRTTWNEIERRLRDYKQNSRVLYLAGKDNYDLHEAVRRGFSKHNMLAVEKDKETAEEIRKSGQLCIHGDILDVLMAWKDDDTPDVIILDMCCGLNHKTTTAVQDILFSSDYGDSVFVVNLLRGRDWNTCFFKSEYYNSSNLKKRITNFIKIYENKYVNVNNIYSLHRGMAAWLMYFPMQTRTMAALCAARSLGINPIDMFRGVADNSLIVKETIRNEEVKSIVNAYDDLLFNSTPPVFMSYKSDSGQVFDSVVFTVPGGWGRYGEGLFTEINDKQKCHNRKKISNILALSKMKERGVIHA